MTSDERFDRTDRSIENLVKYILDLRLEVATRLQTIENRLDILSSSVANIDSRLPPLTEAILGFPLLPSALKKQIHSHR